MLEMLFRDWHQHFAQNGAALKKHKADYMVFDGFCPYYFSQKKRILFIGREPRWISGKNYINVLCSHYVTKLVGSTPLNADKFHSRMIKIAYGILKEWKDIENKDAEKLGDMLGKPKPDGLSFAFMNISKLSNDSDDWRLDLPVYNEAHRLSTEGRNFIEKEIAILEPQIVIAMNLEKINYSLGKLSASIHASAGVHSCWLESEGHRSLFIDSWHFSDWKKQDIADYYDPICDAIRHSEAVAVGEQPVGGK